MLKRDSRPAGACLRLILFVAPLVAALVGATGCSAPRDDSPAASGAADAPAGEAAPHAVQNPALHNLLWDSERIYSGGEPHGGEAFAELARLGVTTIVSVDGARPDVEAARAHGLRYVHIPIGYDGVGDEAGRSLARLVRDAEGPFYIHCRHGRHRGPAAAAVACIASGDADNAGARTILELAGTSADYAGLWRDVEAYRPPPPDAELPELVEVAEVGSFAAAMAQIDRAYDNLKLCRDAGWTTPADHPDIVPSREALLLREGLHESGRALDADAEPELRAWLAEAEETARGLQSSLESDEVDGVSRGFETLVKSCTRCHAAYRN